MTPMEIKIKALELAVRQYGDKDKGYSDTGRWMSVVSIAKEFEKHLTDRR
jgi:hypothetical protein